MLDHPLDSDCKTETITAGIDDSFAFGSAEIATPSQQLWEFINYQYRIVPNVPNNELTKEFDGTSSNTAFGQTFTLPGSETGIWKNIQGATLTFRVRVTNGQAYNDYVQLISHDDEGNMVPVYQLQFAYANNNSWQSGDEILLVFDLANLPAGSDTIQSGRNVLSALQDGALDIYIQDDTAVDFMELRATTCPCVSDDCARREVY